MNRSNAQRELIDGPADAGAEHRETDIPDILDMIFGRWRSQILVVGTRLGVFDSIPLFGAMHAIDLASKIGADPSKLYRLCRALASIGLLNERTGRRFQLTSKGACLRSDHPAQLRKMALLEEGQVHYTIWRHLEDIVLTGTPDGMKREFGASVFDYTKRDHDYARLFSDAMASYSAVEGPAIAQSCASSGFASEVVCDIGGNDGRLLAEVLSLHPGSQGIVIDLPEVVNNLTDSNGGNCSHDGRIQFVGGDMFAAVPKADVYFLKHILHDWSDDDCIRILRNAREAGSPASRLFVCECIVPAPDQPHFSKLFDIHMMVWQTGEQRTEAETSALLEQAGWKLKAHSPAGGTPMSVLEAVKI